MTSRKILYLACGLLVLALSLVTVVQAAEFQTDKSGNIALTDNSKEVRNLYTAGNMVSINQDIKKDLLAAGNIITLGGQVEDDFWAAGNTIVVRGAVGGSLRAAGSNILIEAPVKEDVLVVGGNITIASSAVIGGDLVIAGGNLIIDGPIAGDILVNGGNLTINAKVGGSIKGTLTDQFKLGPKAEIAGNLAYKAPQELTMDTGAKVLGQTDYTKYEYKGKEKELAGWLTMGWLIKLIATFIAGLILVYLLRPFSTQAVKKSLEHFWPSLGIGFAVLILTPIAAIILLVTVIGSWAGGLLFLAYGLMLMLSAPLASIIAGSWLVKSITKKSEHSLDWLAVLVGTIVLGVISLLPVIGWLVCLVFFLIALGAVYKLTYQAISKK